MTTAAAAGFHVAVMAKYPTAGHVKTRLARRVGAPLAAELQRAFVLDLDERLRQAGFAATWAYWPPDAPFGALLPHASLLAQQGTDLGARMAGVALRLFERDGIPVVLLGADAPHVDLTLVHAAGRALVAGGDVVLGPADDGGYYLLGLRRHVPELFEGVPWGGGSVCRETRTRCAALGLAVTLLAGGFDVDEEGDLARLARLLEDGAVVLPRTAAILARRTTR